MKKYFLDALGNLDKKDDIVFTCCKGFKASTCASFIKKLDDDIKKLGNSIFWLLPKKEFRLVSEGKESNINALKEKYGMNFKYTTKDKAQGLLLIRTLSKNKNVTPKEFIKKLNN